MKKACGVFILILFLLVSAKTSSAQAVEGKRFEFSTSASMWNVKYRWSTETRTVFNVPVRIGFFLFKGLEIEPEVFLTIPEDSDYTGILFLGNLVYNFKASKKAIPFILGGFGIGNGLQEFSIAEDWGESVTALNFGAGIKFLVGSSAALRIEYRFTKYWEAGEYLRTDNNIYVGFSVFF